MEKFQKINSSAVPLPMENTDTDQIIPARFLKATTREGFGENLFADWRLASDGSPNENFVLNSKIYRGSILIAGRNFGCGSSREHAAWALYDYGFRAVVSSFFADIFKGNALNNGLLPITITTAELDQVFLAIEKNPLVQFEIDLETQLFTCPDIDLKIKFEINSYKRHCLLNGLDDTDFLVSQKVKIEAFEKRTNRMEQDCAAMQES